MYYAFWEITLQTYFDKSKSEVSQKDFNFMIPHLF
jgi:hypothetical protein